MKPFIVLVLLVSFHLGVATAAAVGPTACWSWVAEAARLAPGLGE